MACPMNIHSMDCAIGLVATTHQTPAGINHKTISKPKMNPHKCNYTYIVAHEYTEQS